MLLTPDSFASTLPLSSPSYSRRTSTTTLPGPDTVDPASPKLVKTTSPVSTHAVFNSPPNSPSPSSPSSARAAAHAHKLTSRSPSLKNKIPPVILEDDAVYCAECAERDADMTHVDVRGVHAWDRESDVDFRGEDGEKRMGSGDSLTVLVVEEFARQSTVSVHSSSGKVHSAITLRRNKMMADFLTTLRHMHSTYAISVQDGTPTYVEKSLSKLKEGQDLCNEGDGENESRSLGFLGFLRKFSCLGSS